MSRKKLALIIALIVSAGAIASGIVYAQEASSPPAETLRALLNAEAESSQEPGGRSFSYASATAPSGSTATLLRNEKRRCRRA